MESNNALQPFENRQIRTVWDEEKEELFFSVVDVVGALTYSDNPRRYWSDLKRKLRAEGASELYDNLVQLRLMSSDGKYYKTDATNTEGILLIIQSIPSPKAEPFKQWLAMVGSQRLDETADPELAIQRALLEYRRKGYSDKWITQRHRRG